MAVRAENLGKKPVSEMFEGPAQAPRQPPVLPSGRGYVPAYTDFLTKAMAGEPKNRLSAGEALQHPFLKDPLLSDAQARAVLNRLLQARGQGGLDSFQRDPDWRPA
jgi:serine/threonine protein kinase